MADQDRTASLMTPSKLAQVKPQAAGSPAAWLDQMAADAGHQHVRRLRELQEQLRAEAGKRDFVPLGAQLAHLAEALPRLDFGLLQARGWWARATGKSRSAGAEFAAQFAQIEKVTQSLATEVQGLQKKHQAQASAGDLALLEVEVEFRALDKIIDQGARWLHDMRNQLKTRQAADPDEAGRQKIKDDSARCEILVDRLKALRAASSAAQQAHQQAQAAAARRAGMAQMLKQALASDVTAWRARLSKLAAAANDTHSAALKLDDAMETHRDLQLWVKQATADCGQLQGQEKTLADSLEALGTQLDARA